jgi:hypothetical protein
VCVCGGGGVISRRCQYLDQCFSTAGPRPGTGPSSYRKKNLPDRGLATVENHWSRLRVYNVGWSIGWWMMIWERFRVKCSCINWGTLPALPYRDWEKPRKMSVMIVDIPEWSEHIMNVVKFQLRPTVSLSVCQSVSLSWCRAPPGAHDQILVSVWQLRFYPFICQSLLAKASQLSVCAKYLYFTCYYMTLHVCIYTIYKASRIRALPFNSVAQAA